MIMRFMFGNREREAVTDALRDANAKSDAALTKVEGALDTLLEEESDDRLRKLVHNMRSYKMRRDIKNDPEWTPGSR